MTLKEFSSNYIIPNNDIPLYKLDLSIINSSLGEKYWQSLLKVEAITEEEIDLLPLLAKYALAVSFLSHIRFQVLRNQK